LDDHSARPITTTGAAGDLTEYLSGSFRCAKVGKPQGDICIDHPHQGHSRNVVPFSDHLSSDENPRLTTSELRENFLHAPC